MRRVLAVLLCAAIASSGCAAATRPRQGGGAPASPEAIDPRLMADYVRQIPVGSRVKLTLTDGSVLHATLMKRDVDPIVVQRRARIPEAPREIAIRDIRALEIETGSTNIGRTIAISAAAAVGATLGVLFILAAIFSD